MFLPKSVPCIDPCVIYNAETQNPKIRESHGHKSHFSAMISWSKVRTSCWREESTLPQGLSSWVYWNILNRVWKDWVHFAGFTDINANTFCKVHIAESMLNPGTQIIHQSMKIMEHQQCEFHLSNTLKCSLFLLYILLFLCKELWD